MDWAGDQVISYHASFFSFPVQVLVFLDAGVFIGAGVFLGAGVFSGAGVFLGAGVLLGSLPPCQGPFPLSLYQRGCYVSGL